MFRRAWLFVIVAAMFVPAARAGAHTEVQRATPGPGQVVEGTVDEIVLVFLDEIRPGPVVAVTGPGSVTVGEPDLRERTVRVDVSGVDRPGDYVVRYSFTAMDGDHQSEAYRFTVTDGSGVSVPVGAVVAGCGIVVAVGVARRARRGAGG